MIRYQLLSVERDHKTSKNTGVGVLTGVLYLQPHTGERVGGLERYNVCPFATPGCAAVCLNYSGKGFFPSTQTARAKKSRLFRDDVDTFIDLLKADFRLLVFEAQERSLDVAVRLNGTSDILWERLFDMGQYPIQFYDYTKWPYQARFSGRRKPENYHITYSWSEHEDAAGRAQVWLDMGAPVAVVFSQKAEIPSTWGAAHGLKRDYPVTDGDLHDVRFWDRESIVALKTKGIGARDRTGFVQR